ARRCPNSVLHESRRYRGMDRGRTATDPRQHDSTRTGYSHGRARGDSGGWHLGRGSHLSAMKMLRPHTAGFSLIEVALALGVAAFALVAIIGLIPVGLNSNQASSEQTAAAGLAAGII